MELKSRQPQWDIYEAVILLDGYLEALKKAQPRAHIIKRVSQDLRQMAENRGITIDEVYRNENGISYQMQSMESAYKGQKVYVPATRLFREAVDLYRDNYEQYLSTLTEARRMIDARPDTKKAFLEWAASAVSQKKFKWIEANLKKAEQFGIKAKLISGSLFDVVDENVLASLLNAIQKNKVFKISNRVHYGKILGDFMLYMRYCAEHPVIESKEPEAETASKDEIPASTSEESESGSPIPVSGRMVDFCNIGSMAYTKPISFEYKGKAHDAKKWGSLYVKLISMLRVEFADLFDAAVDKKTFHSDALMIASEEKKHLLRMPRAIGGGQYIEGNCSATRIVKGIKGFLDLCGVPYDQLHIRYQKLDDTTSADDTSTGTMFAVEVNPEIASVLRQHYQFGFKYESIREMMRFRQFAAAMDITLPSDDEELKREILASGTVIEDRVYCKSDDLPSQLQSIIEDVFSTGAEVIYYECLFDDQAEWMSSHLITSDNMLNEYLQKHVCGCSFSKKFMNRGAKLTEKAAVTSEIKRVWGDKQTESVDVLSEKLPYIPKGNIWRVISGNDDFVLSSEGVYLLVDRLRITDDEIEDILDFVSTTCEEKGFASLSDVPLGDIEEENYELTALAIYNAIYKKVLIQKYHLNGKIPTVDNPDLDVITLLKQFIAGRDSCSFDEVSEKVVDLTGGINRQYAFQALYDEMVRTEANRFVANRFVDFRVDEIDRILAGFVTDHFVAIRDITTFAMFPLCGQNWNHYLLESYCYKYSKKYSLHVLHFNDKNAGIIAERTFDRQYVEMLALALARTDIELTPEAAGQYLFNTGYMAKSKYARLEEIIQQARELRERK